MRHVWHWVYFQLFFCSVLLYIHPCFMFISYFVWGRNMKFPCFFPSSSLYSTLSCTPYRDGFMVFVFCSFLFFEREKIHRDFVNTEYTFDSMLPHCFLYILANNWYYLTLILIFFCQPVKECVIVLFLISLIAREFKYFFTDLLTIQISLVWVANHGCIHFSIDIFLYFLYFSPCFAKIPCICYIRIPCLFYSWN